MIQLCYLIILQDKKILHSKIRFLSRWINDQYFFLFSNSFALSETGPKGISRKRKKSISEDNDIKHRNIVLRRRKSVSVIEIDRKKPKKQRNRTINSTLPLMLSSYSSSLFREANTNSWTFSFTDDRSIETLPYLFFHT